MLIKRNYDWDDLQMLERANFMLENFESNLDLFQNSFKNCNQTYLKDFKESLNKAKRTQLDIEISKSISTITKEIDLIMLNSRKLIQRLFIYVKTSFPSDKNILKDFGKSDFEKARNSKALMVLLLDKTFENANKTLLHNKLIEIGFNKEDILLIQKLKTDLIDKLSNREVERKKRQKYTKERIKIYNKVWSYLENISNASKIVFIGNNDEIKKYLLYPSLHNLPNKLLLQYNKKYNFLTWEADNNSEEYELVYKPIDSTIDWIKIYIGIENKFLISKDFKKSMFKCRGVNKFGIGYWSEVIFQDID